MDEPPDPSQGAVADYAEAAKRSLFFDFEGALFEAMNLLYEGAAKAESLWELAFRIETIEMILDEFEVATEATLGRRWPFWGEPSPKVLKMQHHDLPILSWQGDQILLHGFWTEDGFSGVYSEDEIYAKMMRKFLDEGYEMTSGESDSETEEDEE